MVGREQDDFGRCSVDPLMHYVSFIQTKRFFKKIRAWHIFLILVSNYNALKLLNKSWVVQKAVEIPDAVSKGYKRAKLHPAKLRTTLDILTSHTLGLLAQ